MRERLQREPGVVTGQWSTRLQGGRVRCDLCPRLCTLKEGQRGFCFVRRAHAGAVELTSYGRASGFCIDPIEKKPLNHFFPGSSVLSFGTAGCNLGCKFCQNWDISKAREANRLTDAAMPEAIVRAATEAGCKSIAFTYNDPVIFAEYAIDCAQAAHAAGLKTVAVTAGYITERARPAFFEHLDAVNVDLKAFTERFYRRLCFAHLQPVLDTLRWLRASTQLWLEVTTLLIPGENDSPDEVQQLADWIARELGPETPLHLTAFHPDFKLLEHSPTPPSTLARARSQALQAGLKHVYTGNVHDADGQSTYCGGCGQRVIERDWYSLGEWQLDPEGNCQGCGKRLAGHFDPQPGTWGAQRRRLVVQP